MRTRLAGLVIVALFVAFSLVLPSSLSPAPPALAQQVSDVPTLFAAENGVINALTSRDGTVYWGAPCCQEICPTTTFVRSRPAGDGPIRTLFERTITCVAESVWTNLVLDESYVYWGNAQKELVKQRRAATAGELPTPVTTLPAASSYDLAVDGTYIYWLEQQSLPAGGGRLVRRPKLGGATLAGTITGQVVADLNVDAAGNAYYLHGQFPGRM